MATDDDDAATLRERVRDLEATVAQQQDTIQQLMPSRRAVLAGGAGLVGGAALTGQASAQSAAGQVGTSSEPVDVEAATVNADSVNTASLISDPDGAGYVWTDFTGDRSFDDWQTPPDRDIWLAVSVDINATGTTVDLRPDVGRSQSNNAVVRYRQTINDGIVSLPVIKIPANQNYRVRSGADTADFSVNKWMELR